MLQKKYLTLQKKHKNFSIMQDIGTITATPNFSKRTFTIRKKYKNGEITVYRTNKMNKPQFDTELNNTENDWHNFLKGNDYYLVK